MTAGPDLVRRPVVYDISIQTPRGGMAVGADSAEVLDNDLLPWFHWLDGLNTPSATSPALNTAHLYNTAWPLLGLSWTTPAAATAVGSFLAWDIWTAEGTWTLQVPCDNRGDYPIVQYAVDDVNVGPTFDRYAAAGAIAHHVVPGIVLARGYHRFKSIIVGKNAASTAYTHVFSGAMLTRTA